MYTSLCNRIHESYFFPLHVIVLGHLHGECSPKIYDYQVGSNGSEVFNRLFFTRNSMERYGGM